MLMACAGCSTSPPAEPLVRVLPEIPGFAQPVLLPLPRLGDDTLLIAARERAGRAKANQTITCFVEWYRAVKDTYGATKAEAEANSALQFCKGSDHGK